MPNKGRDGEAAAASFFEEKGMQILSKNFRSKRGEIDIIALDDQTLVFAEVKTWSKYGIDALENAINIKKQHKIIETSKYFLSLHRKYRYMAIRFDVIFVSPEGITHLASAFSECV
ncbi:MAG: YraN family protein [Treponema sp.]|jgi:putative endonuclease|nr:YraN family protein [Treponema sp.]